MSPPPQRLLGKLGQVAQDFLRGFLAVEPDAFDGGIGARVAADEGTGRQRTGTRFSFARMADFPAIAISGGPSFGRDAPDFLVLLDQLRQVDFGRCLAEFAAVMCGCLNDEDRFVAHDAPDFVVLAVAASEHPFGVGKDAAIGFTDLAQVGPAVLEKGDEGGVVIGGRLPQTKKADGLRTGRGADDRVIIFIETGDAARREGEGTHFRIGADLQAMGKDVGEIIVPLEHVEAWPVGADHGVVILVEDGRDDGTELPQAGEQFPFEIARLRGEELNARIDEMSLPELGRAASAHDGGALEYADFNAHALQGLGTAQPRKAGPYDRNRTKFFHCDNVNICVQRAITIRYRLQQIRFAVDFWSGGSSLKSL